MSTTKKSLPLLDPALVRPALLDALRKLSPKAQLKNPVMFVVYIGSLLTSLLWLQALIGEGDASAGFILAVALWLWFTVLFANFAEALAEGRGKAQASALRTTRKRTYAKVLQKPGENTSWIPVPNDELSSGKVILVEAGDLLPADGEVIEGAASVDESAITGESAPVIRAAGGDSSSVTGGTRLLSDRLLVRVTSNPGDSYLDRMIAMVEGAKRQKTPNEIALTILLVGLTLVFLLVVATLWPFSLYAGQAASITMLMALLVCLIPTTIGALLSAIGVAGMSRMMQTNVIATSGRAVEAAGDVDILLLDKTGTITLGNRKASAFIPVAGLSEKELAEAAQLTSLADETPEGRSIVELAADKFGLARVDLEVLGAKAVPFSAETRMSGVDLTGGDVQGPAMPDPSVAQLRKGAASAIRAHVESLGGVFPAEVDRVVDAVARRGSTPLVVADNSRVVGVVELKDIVKEGIKERFGQLRRMGIKTIMITGDNPLTAAAIAAEAGVDNYLAEATPEAKLKLIRDYQEKGHLVAMTGDGTNDAPALAQADVAVAMNSGTQAAKEAGNMVDLDSSPTKLVEVVETGKQLLMTRGALTTFSVSNDVAKYFAILPAMFVATYPQLAALDVMGLNSPTTAILSAVIFNALIIVLLIPLALKGVKYRPLGAAILLRRNMLIYGLGGLIAPFVGIKLIDMLLGLFI